MVKENTILIALTAIGGAYAVSKNQAVQEQIETLKNNMGGTAGFNFKMPEFQVPNINILSRDPATSNQNDSGLFDSLKDLFSGLKQNVSDAKDTIIDNVPNNPLDNAIDTAKSNYGKVTELGVTTMKTAQNKAISDSINWFLGTGVGKGLFTLGAAQNFAYNKIKDTGGSVVGKVKDAVSGSKKTTSKSSHVIVAGTKENAGSIVNKINQSVSSTTKKTQSNFQFPHEKAVFNPMMFGE